MEPTIYLRPLVLEDAKVSYKWRNDHEIWKFTKYLPTEIVTPEMETDWLKGVLGKPNEKRFAICTCNNHQYIGNVYFADIVGNTASAHIVLGEKQFWGKGIASEIAPLFIGHGFMQMGLERIYLEVNDQNYNMIGFYSRLGFEVYDKSDEYLKMVLLKQNFSRYPEKNVKAATTD
jgi:diamine N-acetyltransferase